METNWLPLEQEKLIFLKKDQIDGVFVDSMLDPESLPIAIKASFDEKNEVLTILFKYSFDVENGTKEFSTKNESLKIVYGADSKKIVKATFNLNTLNAYAKNEDDVFSYEINRIKGSQKPLTEYIKELLDMLRKAYEQKAQSIKILIHTSLTPA